MTKNLHLYHQGFCLICSHSPDADGNETQQIRSLLLDNHCSAAPPGVEDRHSWKPAWTLCTRKKRPHCLLPTTVDLMTFSDFWRHGLVPAPPRLHCFFLPLRSWKSCLFSMVLALQNSVTLIQWQMSHFTWNCMSVKIMWYICERIKIKRQL